MSTEQQVKGFFESLFDFSFTTFFTPRVIKVLYGLEIAQAAFVSLFLVIISFIVHPAMGVIMLLIGAPLVFLICLIYGRVILELLAVSFRISERLDEIAEQGRKGSSSSSSGNTA